MHIVFGHVGYWQIPIIKLFKYFKLKISYLVIDSESKFQKNAIANKLKEKNITPLPIEFEKFSPKISYSLLAEDPDEFKVPGCIATLNHWIRDSIAVDSGALLAAN